MVEVLLKGRWLVVSFDEPCETRSWAIYGGPRKITRRVVWYQVQRGDLGLAVDAREFAKNLFIQNGLQDAVGMLTGAALSRYVDIEKVERNLSVRSIATVGMTNALRVGDLSCSLQSVGTINLLCVISTALTEETFLEAISIAVEARTTAVLDCEISSSKSGLRATGTGTDCIVVAAPARSVRPPLEYAGKHTLLGSLIGGSVLEAVSQGFRHSKSDAPLTKLSLNDNF